MKIIKILICLFISLPFMAQAMQSDAAADIQKRIQPVGQVKLAQASPVASVTATTAAVDGKTTYSKYCSVCHAAGIAGAPKKGDEAAWAPRAKQGIATLLKHAKSGLNAMPPKGTCATCSDADLKAAIQYIVPSNLLK